MESAESRIVARHGALARRALGVYGAGIFLFLFAPIVVLVVFSFNANRYGTFPITGWTTDWYSQVFHDFEIQDAISTSLKVAVQVVVVSTVIGTAGAFPLVRSNLPFRNAVRLGFTLPIMIPGLLIGVSLLVLFTQVLQIGELGLETAVIGQSVFCTPFVLLLVASRLEGFDRSVERAAADLGANAVQRLRHVVLPLLAPAIVAGALFAFTLSIDEYVITSFLIGSNSTLPIYIFGQVKAGITPEVNALATLLIVASVLLLGSAAALALALRRVRRWMPELRRRPPAAQPPRAVIGAS
jgi:ABC-type spermidine/putrescine transport system permease subunit II